MKINTIPIIILIGSDSFFIIETVTINDNGSIINIIKYFIIESIIGPLFVSSTFPPSWYNYYVHSKLIRIILFQTIFIY